MNRTVRIILSIVVLVLVAGGSFYGGTIYGKTQAQASFAARRQGAFPGANQGGALPGAGQGGAAQFQRGVQGGMLFGQIKELGDGFIMVTDNNGKETRVNVTDTTLIEKNMSVKPGDLTVGETVIVSGSQGTDGSITARSVQVMPAGRLGFGGPGGPGATPVP